MLFPAVQRHRYFRLKQRLPLAAAHAARLAAAAFLGAAATAALRARGGGGSGGAALTLGGSAGALLAGWLCALCWLMGAAALEVVFTERLRPDDYSARCAPCWGAAAGLWLFVEAPRRQQRRAAQQGFQAGQLTSTASQAAGVPSTQACLLDTPAGTCWAPWRPAWPAKTAS